MKKRDKRNDAFFKCKKYALNSDYPMAGIWLARAEKLCPLTELQAWSFKKIVGLDRYLEIVPKRLLEFGFVNIS